MGKIENMIEYVNKHGINEETYKDTLTLDKMKEIIDKFNPGFYEWMAFEIRITGHDKVIRRNIEILRNKERVI